MSALEPQSYRTVIHELDVHHRAEFAGLDAKLLRSQVENESFVKRDREIRSCGVDETRPPPFLRVTVESELRNNENLSAHVGKREVHFVLSIGEESQARHLLGHPLDLRKRVRCGETDENQKSATDFPGGPLVDANFRTRDALEQNAQALLDRD
jgi:hypothetical protein